MNNQSVTRTLANFIATLRDEEIPPEVLTKAKTCILDGVANALGGLDWPWSAIAHRTAASLDACGTSTVWGTELVLSAAEATFANTVTAHSILHEDMHMESQSHLGTMIVPAAIAQAEANGSSGRELLSAVIAGYEVGGRVGKTIVSEHFNESGHRPSGSFGPIATAAAVSRLLGLSEDQATNALGMAASQGAGTNEFAAAGTMDIYFQNAFAARNGLVAAYLGRDGIQVAPEAIEGRAGMGRMLSGRKIDAGRIVNRLKQDWEILNVYHKPAPACAYLQSAIQAAQRLVGRRTINPDTIERVIVRTFLLGKHCPGTDNAGPFRRIMDAQMSNQFVIAAVLLHGRVALDHFRDFQSPAIEQLAARIEVEVDPRAVQAFPQRKAGGIEILFKNGDKDQEWVDDLAYPSPQFVDDKFDEYAKRVLDRSSADRIRETVRSLETIRDVRVLGTILRAGQASQGHDRPEKHGALA